MATNMETDGTFLNFSGQRPEHDLQLRFLVAPASLLHQTGTTTLDGSCNIYDTAGRATASKLSLGECSIPIRMHYPGASRPAGAQDFDLLLSCPIPPS